MASDTTRRPRRSPRILWVSLGVLGVLVVSALVWVGVRGLMLRSELDDAVHAASEMQQQLQASDIAAARGSACDAGGTLPLCG